MRDAAASIDAMIAEGQFTLATCVKIVARDGSELGFTDLDRDVTVALGSDTGSSPVTYSAGGMVLGDIDLATGLDADNTELRIPLSDVLTQEDVLGRRFNQADIYIFDIDHRTAAPQPLEVMKGLVADAEVQEGEAVFEIRSVIDRMNQVVGNILTPRCRVDFGDTECGVVKVPVGGTVTAVESTIRFTTDLGGAYADQYFRFGDLDFLTGRLANIWPFEVVQFNGTTGVVELFTPLPNLPEVGDTFHIYQGCSKLKTSSDASVPTCFTHNNVTRFRGYDRVPGSDTYVKVKFPGGG